MIHTLKKETLFFYAAILLSSVAILVLGSEYDYIPMILFCSYALIFLIPVFGSFSLKSYVYLIFFLTIFLDLPAGNPYYTHTPFTEIIGHFYFSSIRALTGIPVVTFSFFELTSFFLAASVLYNRTKFLKSGSQGNKFIGFYSAIIFIFPIACLASISLGIIKGYDLSLAITQTRNIPLLVSWNIIGFFILSKKEDIRMIFRIITAASLYKALYGLFFFIFFLKLKMGNLEYLIDHMSSFFLATSILYLLAEYILSNKKNVYNTILLTIGITILTIPYILNERRASFIGVIFVLLFLPFIVKKSLRYKLVIPYLLGAFLGLMVLIYSKSEGNDFASLVQGVTLDGEKIVSYRELENFNLYFSVMLHPITGLSFGSRYPILAPMPNISFAYDLFDAIPHNTLLYIWAYSGPFGLAAFGVYIAFCISCCVKLMSQSKDIILILVSFISFTILVRWMTWVYADIGLLDLRIGFIMAGCSGSMLRIYSENLHKFKPITH